MSQNIFRQSTKTKKHQINLTYVRVYYLLLTYFIEKKKWRSSKTGRSCFMNHTINKYWLSTRKIVNWKVIHIGYQISNVHSRQKIHITANGNRHYKRLILNILCERIEFGIYYKNSLAIIFFILSVANYLIANLLLYY